jgi:hypothetical protein
MSCDRTLARALTIGTAACGLALGASGAGAADTCRVTLRNSDPLWNRPRDSGSTTSVACNASAQDSQNDGVPYRLVKFRTTVSEQLSITVTSQQPATSTFDPFIGVYCAAFAPVAPLANLISLDDDSAGWPNPAISTTRNIILTPNVDYFLVVSAYSSTGQTPYGTVLITLGGQARFTQTLPGCCKADFNQSGQVNVQDIFDFLAAWFANGAGADFNGTGGITVQDVFDFLAAWFVGC